MNKKMIGAALVALPLALGGFVLANSRVQSSDPSAQGAAGRGYTCPVTGEELRCPHCCPLNKGE